MLIAIACLIVYRGTNIFIGNNHGPILYVLKSEVTSYGLIK